MSHDNQPDRFEKENTRCDKLIRGPLPEGFTYGYIGNVEDWGDDRSWFITAPHEGRAADYGDIVGDTYSTQDRRRLLSVAHAIRAGYRAAKTA